MAKKQFHHEQVSKMIARTHDGDPVWRTDFGKGPKGRPFIIDGKDGKTIKPLGFFWWLPIPGRRLRFLPKPHLTYTQVAAAQAKSKVILAALRKGPITLDRGFLKSRSGKILGTKKISAIVIYWMEGCGIVFTKEHRKSGKIVIDIDVEATRKNKVS